MRFTAYTSVLLLPSCPPVGIVAWETGTKMLALQLLLLLISNKWSFVSNLVSSTSIQGTVAGSFVGLQLGKILDTCHSVIMCFNALSNVYSKILKGIEKNISSLIL